MVAVDAPWAAYLAFEKEKDRDWPEVSNVISSLLAALSVPGHTEPPPEIRRRLIAQLLATLSPPPSTSSQAQSLHTSSSPSVLTPVLSLIKTLGRSAAGSEELGREQGIATLLTYGGLNRVATQLPPRRSLHIKSNNGLGISNVSDDEDDDEDGPRTAMPIQDEADPLSASESEALRTLCNVLTLQPSARELFGTVLQQDPKWVSGLVRLLCVSGAGFLAGRLLFLLTSKQSSWIAELAERGEVVDALEDYATGYVDALRSPFKSPSLTSGPMPTRTDVLREHLKLSYNLMLQFGRLPARSRQMSADSDDHSETSDAYSESGSRPTSPVPPFSPAMGGKKKRFWSSREVTPDVNTTHSSPSPTGSPSLGSLQGEGTKRSKSPRQLARRLKSAVKRSARVPLPVPLPTTSIDGGGSSLTVQQATHFLPLFRPYLSLAVLLPLEPQNSPEKDPSSLLRNALNTLLNFPLELEELDGYTYSWLQPVDGAVSAFPSLPDLPSRLFETLDWTFKAWFPVDKWGTTVNGDRSKLRPSPPDELVPRGTGDASRAEEIIAPLVLLARKLSLLTEAGDGFKALLLPPDLDRTVGPDQQPTMLGHLVRLMASILLPNSAYGAGEFLYNLCDRDASQLSTALGYGNVAGFLQNRGELVPPPPMPDPAVSSLSDSKTKDKGKKDDNEHSSSGEEEKRRAVNPITGAYESTVPKGKELAEMTDEEKEREAEKLYVLFDRMAKTGVMDVENPIRKAKAEGKMEGDAREEEKRRIEEEEKEEREALEEMRRYKERKRMTGAGTTA